MNELSSSEGEEEEEERRERKRLGSPKVCLGDGLVSEKMEAILTGQCFSQNHSSEQRTGKARCLVHSQF